MVTYLQSLAQYNVWANIEVCLWLDRLSEDKWTIKQISSFDSIAATVAHIVAAENIWMQRLNLVEKPIWIGDDDLGSKEEYLQKWQSSSAAFKNYCADLTIENLNKAIPFKRLNGEAYTLEVMPILAHVFNHSTYHRGQLVTMLRVAGYSDISSIDLSTFWTKFK